MRRMRRVRETAVVAHRERQKKKKTQPNTPSDAAGTPTETCVIYQINWPHSRCAPHLYVSVCVCVHRTAIYDGNGTDSSVAQ